MKDAGPATAAAPPSRAFGHPARELWPLDPAVLYLNHGTVGVTPRAVLAEQQRIRDEIEREPARFQLRELATGQPGAPPGPPRLRRAAAEVAAFVGAREPDLAFVDNATTGANAVLRSFPFEAGDEALVTGLGYGAVTNAARHAAGERGATVRVAEIPYPVSDPGQVTEAILGAVTPRTRLAVVDHVTSESALVLPLREILDALRARGVAVLVDGAHAPGALDLDLEALGADWYVANLHKWAFAPRSCGFLWAPPERQEGLHPPVISWGYGHGFLAEFDLVGTRDPSPFLAAPAGIGFLRSFGVEALRAYQRERAWEAGRALADAWGTRLETPRSMIGSMVTVPLPERAGATPEDAQRLRDALLYEDRIEVQMHAARGRLWARVSTPPYVEAADFERLAGAVTRRM